MSSLPRNIENNNLYSTGRIAMLATQAVLVPETHLPVPLG